jgi:3-oxoacyl-[acyl-carrier protein] reductase
VRLSGKAAVITGGASGFGRASALRFALEGAQVMVVDLNEPGVAEVAAQIRQAGGVALHQQVDVTRAEQVEAAWKRARQEFGRLDIVFNNAGMPQRAIPVEQTPEGLFRQLLEVNVMGVFIGSRAAIPIMREQGGGVILNTCSTAGVRPRPGLVPYGASKAAAIVFTKGLALEVAKYRIRAVAICPVAADTPMLPTFLEGFAENGDLEAARQRFISTIPWGRLNTAEDVAHAAVFLASDEAEMVTGTAFEVDGGRDA